MLHEVLDSARSAAEVPLQTRTHHAPTQSGPVAHGVVRILDAQHTLLNQVHDLAIERRLETISWTKSAPDSAFFMSVVKPRRSRDAPVDRPMLVSTFHASSTYLRRFASAFGAGSVATTSNPRARYSAAQLAPMTPVPTIAIRRIGLLYDILIFLCVDFCVSDSGEIPLRDEQRFLFRAIEFCGIDGPG